MPKSNARTERGSGPSEARARRETSQKQPARPAHAQERKHLDKELDKALKDSFPASDPPAPAQPTGTEPAGDPKTKP